MKNTMETIERLIKEKEELYNALKLLWKVRGNPFTIEQTQQQIEVYSEVEDIIKKYSRIKG